MTKPVSVIIPTLNEKENIIPLIETINKEFHPGEIIVVDDNSSDGTSLIVRKYQKTQKNVRLINNLPPLGLAHSIQKGIEAAKYKYVAWLDADFSHPPIILNSMYDKIRSADIIIGSWLIKGGHDARRERYIRIFSFFINRLCQLLLFSSVKAYTSGFIMTRKSLFSDYKLRGDYGEYFIDLVAKNMKRGRKITGVPFTITSRRKGITKTAPNCWIFLKRGTIYLAMILKLKIYIISYPYG